MTRSRKVETQDVVKFHGKNYIARVTGLVVGGGKRRTDPNDAPDVEDLRVMLLDDDDEPTLDVTSELPPGILADMEHALVMTDADERLVLRAIYDEDRADAARDERRFGND
jgi:hypothetical protein